MSLICSTLLICLRLHVEEFCRNWCSHDKICNLPACAPQNDYIGMLSLVSYSTANMSQRAEVYMYNLLMLQLT